MEGGLTRFTSLYASHTLLIIACSDEDSDTTLTWARLQVRQRLLRPRCSRLSVPVRSGHMRIISAVLLHAVSFLQAQAKQPPCPLPPRTSPSRRLPRPLRRPRRPSRHLFSRLHSLLRSTVLARYPCPERDPAPPPAWQPRPPATPTRPALRSGSHRRDTMSGLVGFRAPE